MWQPWDIILWYFYKYNQTYTQQSSGLFECKTVEEMSRVSFSTLKRNKDKSFPRARHEETSAEVQLHLFLTSAIETDK